MKYTYKCSKCLKDDSESPCILSFEAALNPRIYYCPFSGRTADWQLEEDTDEEN